MKNEPKEVKEIHTIREKIFEETKNMSPVERAKHARDKAREVIKEYNLEIQYEKPLAKLR